MAEENENTYQLNQDNKEYMLSTSLINDKVRFTCEDSTSDEKPTYTKDFSLEDLMKIHRLFYIIPTIQVAQEELDKAIEKQKIGITKESENSLGIIFYMMIGTEKIDFTLSLPKKVLDQKERDDLQSSHHHHVNENELPASKGLDPFIDVKPRCSCPLDDQRLDRLEDNTSSIKAQHEELKKEVNKLALELINQRKENIKLQKEIEGYSRSEKTAVDKLKAENEDLKKELENLKSLRSKEQTEITDLKNQNNDLKKRLLELEEISKKLETDLVKEKESNIKLKSQKETKPSTSTEGLGNHQLLITGERQRRTVRGEIIKDKSEIEWISKSINKKNKKITFNLLYKATADSDKAEVFHKKCDAAESTIVFVETDKGKRFGGYTSVSWRGDCEDKMDENAFIFSLDKKKIYENIKGDNAIGCYPKFGPTFLGCQIKIMDNAFEKGGSTYEKGLNYNTTEDFELTGGEQNFGIKEIEVYQVIVE